MVQGRRLKTEGRRVVDECQGLKMQAVLWKEMAEG
jgi:hypothetical protein